MINVSDSVISFQRGMNFTRRLLSLQFGRVLQHLVSLLTIICSSLLLWVMQGLYAFRLKQRLSANQTVFFDDLLKWFSELIFNLPISIDILIQLLAKIVDLLLFSLDLHLQHQHFFGEVLLKGLQLVVLELYGLAGEEHFFLVVWSVQLRRVKVGCFWPLDAFVLALALAVLGPQLGVLQGQLANFRLLSLKGQLQLSSLKIIKLGLSQSLFPYLQQLLEHHIQIVFFFLTEVLSTIRLLRCTLF